MENTQNLIGAIIWLAVVFEAAMVGARYRPDDWYGQLQKLQCTPPNWVFGPVWTTLYLLMSVAVWMVWSQHDLADSSTALGLFVVQLVLNAIWSWLFFGKHQPGWALFDIVILWVSVLATTVAFWQLEPVAGGLLLPYLAWVSFATAINAGIWRLNRPRPVFAAAK